MQKIVVLISINFSSMILHTICVNGCHGDFELGYHKTCNGWYLGLVALVSSIVRLLIVYSLNINNYKR